MATVIIANKNSKLSICFLLCVDVKTILQSHYCMNITGPILWITGELRTCSSRICNPEAQNIFFTENDKWSNCGFIGANAFDERNSLLAAKLNLIFHMEVFIDDNMRCIDLSDWKSAFIHVINVLQVDIVSLKYVMNIIKLLHNNFLCDILHAYSVNSSFNSQL